MARDQQQYIERLREVIRKIFKCESEHFATVEVSNIQDGDQTWGGDVEVFYVDGRSDAKICYAWSYKHRRNGMDTETVHAVLHKPPTESAVTAVQSRLALEGQARQAQEMAKEAIKTPWKAVRAGGELRIHGFRPFPVHNPKWHLDRDIENTTESIIAFRFWYEMTDDRAFGYFYAIHHEEKAVPLSINQVKITDETGAVFLIQIATPA